MKKIIKKIKKLIREFIYGKYSMELYRIELQEKINELKITPYDIAKLYIQMYNDNYDEWGLSLKTVIGLEKIQLLTTKTISEFEYIYEVYLVNPDEHKCIIYDNKYMGYENIRINFKRNQIKETSTERKENLLNKRLRDIKKIINEEFLIDWNYHMFSKYFYPDLAYHMLPKNSKIKSLASTGKKVEIPRKYFFELAYTIEDTKLLIEKNIKEKLEKQRKRKKRTKNKTKIKKTTTKKENEKNKIESEEIF